MNSIRPSLIALLAALLPTAARAQDPEPPQAEELDEWAELDQELAGLQGEVYERKPVAELWGYGRTNLFYQDQPDSFAVNIDNVRLNLTGQVTDYNYRVTVEFASGRAQILDAWLSTSLGEDFGFTIGQFRSPFIRSGLVEASDTLMIARTRNGVFYSQRDRGVMFHGNHDRLHWRLAVQNGANGQLERQLTTGHVEVNLIGEPNLPHEGAFGAGDTTRLTVGAGVSNDDTTSDGTAIAVEANYVNKEFSLQAEWLDYDADYSLVDLEQRGNTQPWSVTAGYMIVPDKYELALRYDDFDDVASPMSFDRRTLTGGINRYLEGHAIKWQLNVAAAHKGGDADGLHDLVAAIGLTASF